MTRTTLATLLALLAMVFPANAQWTPNFNLAPTMMQGVILNPCTNQDCDGADRDARDDRRAFSVPRDTPDAGPAAVSNTRYTVSMERRKANYAQFVAKTRAVDPAGADSLAENFRQSDIVASVDGAMRGLGLRADDLADAYAIYWMQAWGAAHGSYKVWTAPQAKAVRIQAARALAATPQFADASDAVKQEMAEAMIVQTAMIDAAMRQAKGNPAQGRALATAVRVGAKASGFNLDAMTLTESGFVPARKKTGDAEGALPDRPSDVKALAATTPAPASAEAPPYVLMTAIGASALGGVYLLGKRMDKRG